MPRDSERPGNQTGAGVRRVQNEAHSHCARSARIQTIVGHGQSKGTGGSGIPHLRHCANHGPTSGPGKVRFQEPWLEAVANQKRTVSHVGRRQSENTEGARLPMGGHRQGAEPVSRHCQTSFRTPSASLAEASTQHAMGYRRSPEAPSGRARVARDR